VPTQRPIPRGRGEGAPRRPRPEPLSPPPEWRRDRLFLEPNVPPASTDPDETEPDSDPYPAMPPSRRPQRRPSYR
jgi:hypothetical protein